MRRAARMLGVFAGLVGLLATGASRAAGTADAPEGAGGLRDGQRDRDRLGWYVPDYARLQVGGFLGSVGGGLGYAAFGDRLNISVLYGFTPAGKAGHAVHAGKLAVDYRPFEVGAARLRFVPFYAGAGLLYAFGGEYFTSLPARYQRIDTNYYPPTALHWMLQLGSELDFAPARGFAERHGLYYEVVAFDSYIFSYFENPDRLRFVDTLASTLGYRLAF